MITSKVPDGVILALYLIFHHPTVPSYRRVANRRDSGLWNLRAFVQPIQVHKSEVVGSEIPDQARQYVLRARVPASRYILVQVERARVLASRYESRA